MNARFRSFFDYERRGASLKGDLLGGLVTFLAMCYILPVNSAMLSAIGMSQSGVFAATAFTAAIATILMGLVAKAPIGIASGMGLNAFFAYTMCKAYGGSWQEAMILLTIAGLLTFLLTLTPIREKIMNAFPEDLKRIVSALLGAFMAFVGLKGSGIIGSDASTLVTLGCLKTPSTLLALLGIALVFFLMAFRTKKGILSSLAIPLSIAFVALVGLVLRLCGVEDAGLPSADLSSGWGIGDGFKNVLFYGTLSGTDEVDFLTHLKNVAINPLSYAMLFSLLLLYIFTPMATFMAVGKEAGILDESSRLNSKKPLLVDAFGTVIAAPFGTSTLTSFCESSVGMNSGARSGFASVVTGILFLVSAFLYPLFEVFTASCVSTAALVAVGAIIFAGNLKDLSWDKIEISFSCFFGVLMAVLTYSLSNGVGFTVLAYLILMLGRKKAKDVSPILYATGVIFLASFVLNEVIAHHS